MAGLRQRWILFKSIFWPIGAAIVLLFTLVFGALDFIDLLERILPEADLSIVREEIMGNWFYIFVTENWISILLIGISFSITEGIYKKARYYLGETIVAKRIKLTSEEYRPIRGELFVYILVMNKEYLDLTECSASLKKIKLFVNDEWVDWKKIINPDYSKLTWPDFESGKDIVITRNGGEARINIAKTIPNKFAFIFKSGLKEVYITQKKFYVEISLNGLIGQKPIKEKLLKGILRYESLMIPGGGLIQHDRIIDQSPTRILRLWIEPGELENESPIPHSLKSPDSSATM